MKPPTEDASLCSSRHPQCMEERSHPPHPESGDFAYSGAVIIWYKQSGNFGTGSRTRNVHEVLRIGVRGKKPLTWLDKHPLGHRGTALATAQSQAPQIFHDIIERALPGPRLEFVRSAETCRLDGRGRSSER